ncbi:hypothetical protein K438DRAFT_1993300 [Mycena galopus ATCC 62051]|nr:hypothetical protein K438DRAFT_1993300 [Mycena galopus ATCC 62051]
MHPENCEQTAEIFFESFNIKGLYIAVQAVLTLTMSWSSNQVTDRTLTGTVIDSGDVTREPRALPPIEHASMHILNAQVLERKLTCAYPSNQDMSEAADLRRHIAHGVWYALEEQYWDVLGHACKGERIELVASQPLMSRALL